MMDARRPADLAPTPPGRNDRKSRTEQFLCRGPILLSVPRPPSTMLCPFAECHPIMPVWVCEVPRAFRTVHPIGWAVWKGEIVAPT